MGILRKAAMGSLLIGLGAVAISKNKKAVKTIKKTVADAKKSLMKSTSGSRTRKTTKKSR